MSAKGYSIREKLTGIIMLTSTAAVLLTCLGFMASGLVNLRRQRVADLSTTARLLASNSTAALTFGDPQAAQEVLSALRAKPPVVAAGIYLEHGQLFASYQPNPSISIPTVILADGFMERGDRLDLFYAIRLDGERIGTLYIATDARERNARLKEYAIIASGIGLLSLLVAFLLSWWLQGAISGPIVELARVARDVSEHKSFNVRASYAGLKDGNEIADLMAGFNGMLAEIEQRDHRFLLHQTHLEDTVALRTGELMTANERLFAAKNIAEKVAEINAELALESALILSTATDGIVRVGLDGRATFLNPAAARMLGRTLDEMEGRTIHQVFHHSHADGTPVAETECAVGDIVRRGETFATSDDTFWRADGSSFPVEYSATPMHAEDGSQLGAVLTFRDVTERRAIDRLKSEFVSTVSHELRTPLTSIRGALGLLSSGMLGAVGEKGRRMLEIAVSNTDRLVRLINDILDLERIESGRVELQRGPVDASALMLQAMDGVQSMADEAGVRLTTLPVTAALWGDSDRIIQTLTNLLGNAIKFSPAETTVTLSGILGANEFVFCVTDQGRGVPVAKLETIFERFSQVDGSDSRDKGGSGLGLAICKSIVDAHGGRIWAEANDPAGSRFQFTIPLAVSSVAVGEVRAPGRGAVPSVLLVEDDVDLAKVMTAALQHRGIVTTHAVSGSDAVQRCREDQPSLIVLDLVLPDMDGFDVVAALRMGTAFAGIPLLVYSALDVGAADQARLRLGQTEFLTKSRSSLADFEGHVVRLLETLPPAKSAA